MKIEDMKEAIASAVGLEARSSATEDMLTAFTIFGTGVVLGAGLALLFAPKAGQDIRRTITERVGEIGEHLRARGSQPASSNESTTC